MGNEVSWFRALVRQTAQDNAINVLSCLKGLLENSLVAVDSDIEKALADAQDEGATKLHHIIPQQYVHLALSRELEIDRIVVLDSLDEEAASARIRTNLSESRFPAAILASTKIFGFCADILPAIAAQRPIGDVQIAPDVSQSFPRVYAIASAPRSGSTLLAEYLSSAGLGRPVEHLRPWLIEFFRNRPPGLFDAIRFFQRLVAFGTSNSMFATKLISSFLPTFWEALTSSERSYLRQVSAGAEVIYLGRRNKLDQAISHLRATRSGVWHSTDAGRLTETPLEPRDFEFSELDGMLDYMKGQETFLAHQLAEQALVHNRKIHVLDYDELLRDPNGQLDSISRALSLDIAPGAAAKLHKLADEKSAEIVQRYLADAQKAGRLASVEVDVAALYDSELKSLQSEHEAQSKLALNIRTGHAKSRAGPYQDRHYHLIDYDCFELPGLSGMWRGPRPSSLRPGEYVLFLGAAQTFGAFVADPFSARVGRALDVAVLNLAAGGVSPLFYSSNEAIMNIVRDARVVVVQAMAARMVPNSAMNAIDNMNLVYMRDDPNKTIMDSGVAWEKLRLGHSAEAVEGLVKESRQAWAESMIEIARQANGRAALLWMSERPPAYTISNSSLFGIFERFPQLIDDECLGEVKHAYSHYVEVVVPNREPAPTISFFSRAVLPVIFGGSRYEEQQLQTSDSYYPTEKMHESVAEKLIPLLRTVL